MICKNGIMMIAAMLFITGSVSAQQAKNLSLKEAISLSIQNSGQLKISQAKTDEANAYLQESKERRLPDVKASGSYLRLLQPDIDLKIRSSGNNSGGESPQSSTPKVSQAAYALVNASVPLFSGFRIDAGIESARYLAQAAKLDATTAKDEVILNTIAAYSNLFKAKAAAGLVQENLKQSRQRVEDLSNMEKNGLLARNDLLKAQLQQSNIELSLLDAENNLQIATINMNLMLGLPGNTELITDVISLTAITSNRSVEEWELLALQHRKDAEALSYRRKAADAGVKSAKAAYYPSLAITGGYIAAYIPDVITITNAVNAGIGFSYSPSSLWKAGSQVKKAKAALAQVQATEGILRDGIRIEVNKAYQDYISGIKKVQVYAKAVEQASENFKIVKNKYDNSLATTTDLLDADVAQLQAKLNHAFAEADVMVAWEKLLQAAGIPDETLSNK